MPIESLRIHDSLVPPRLFKQSQSGAVGRERREGSAANRTLSNWISGVRDYALSLACRRRDLPAREGRGFDDLPASVRDLFRSALATSLERDELLRALACAIDGLLREADEVQALASKVEPQLRQLTRAWDGSSAEQPAKRRQLSAPHARR